MENKAHKEQELAQEELTRKELDPETMEKVDGGVVTRVFLNGRHDHFGPTTPVVPEDDHEIKDGGATTSW